MAEHNSVIIDAVRSPIGVKGGHIIGTRSDDLCAQVVAALLARQPKVAPALVEDVVVGCAFPEGPQGMLLGRSVALLAGLPKECGGKVVNRFCGSSMDAVHQLSTAIEAGDLEVGVAAGVEDMFSIPMGGFAPDFHPKLAAQQFYMGMGETAELLAADAQITRADQEAFAIASHTKALAAQAAGRFANELVPVTVGGGSVVERDGGPREPDVAKIRSLKPAFLAGGTVTAATSSPLSIGAAALLLTSRAFALRHGLTPRATILGRAVAGVDWTRMGMGPLPATAKALAKAGVGLDQIEAIELNEAFAAQSLYVIRKGGWPSERINLNGGACALGHPLGCSGARILTTLINVMEQRDPHLGLATMCIGTGQGIATLLRRP